MFRFLFAVVASFCLVSSVSWAEGHKIDFTMVLNDPDNLPMTECADSPSPKDERDCKTHRTITLGLIAMRALVAPDPSISQDESFHRGQLALMIYKNTSVELTAEDIALLKKLIAKSYGPLAVARTFPLLDPAVK